ncbi:hypothetical protein BDQ17DRAFT_138403 [Cyathus striatus]|nr:hypothetical protein BDQ17DRAFT_138403 [Cyathus striatus]
MSGEIDVLNRLVASRYINGGLLAVLLWDHLTTLDREVQLIWKSRGKLRWMLRSAFFLTRYGSEAYLLFNAYVTSGIRIPTADL